MNVLSTSPPASRSAIEDLLAAGAVDQAHEAAINHLAAEPLDAEGWFLQARCLEQAGRLAEAAEACNRALVLWPDPVPVHRLQLHLAQQAADPQTTHRALLALLAAHPDDPNLHGQLGRLLSEQGDHRGALPHLRIAAPVLLHENDAIWNYTAGLALTGLAHELVEAQPLLDRLAEGAPVPYTPYRHLASAKLALLFDRVEVLHAQDILENSSAWLKPTAVMDVIAAAVSQRVPFSLTCLDQELAHFICLTSLRCHVALRPQELLALCNPSWSHWFGDGLAAVDPARITGLGRQVATALGEADLLGLPDRETLRLDNLHFGLLAEMRQAAPLQPGQAAASYRIMAQLHDTMPFLRSVLQGQPFLGLVGDFPDLAARLGRFCGITDTRTILLPGRGSAAAPAFDLYEQALAELTVPFSGAMFLVAVSGPFGPAFSGRIRQLGGIALDIHVVAAAWASR